MAIKGTNSDAERGKRAGRRHEEAKAHSQEVETPMKTLDGFATD